jgi:hypothetical protein
VTAGAAAIERRPSLAPAGLLRARRIGVEQRARRVRIPERRRGMNRAPRQVRRGRERRLASASLSRSRRKERFEVIRISHSRATERVARMSRAATASSARMLLDGGAGWAKVPAMSPASCFALAVWAVLSASACGRGWPGVTVIPTPMPAPTFGDAPERGGPAGPSTELSTAAAPAARPVPVSAGAGGGSAGGSGVGAAIGQAAAAVAAGVGAGVTAAAAATTFRCNPGADTPEASGKINLCGPPPNAGGTGP